jgi:hypothetical protein
LKGEIDWLLTWMLANKIFEADGIDHLVVRIERDDDGDPWIVARQLGTYGDGQTWPEVMFHPSKLSVTVGLLLEQSRRR